MPVRYNEMKISIRVKANSKIEGLEKILDGEYIARVKPPAQEGKANQAVINLLSKYFDIPKSKIIIIKGHNSKNKIVEILEDKDL